MHSNEMFSSDANFTGTHRKYIALQRISGDDGFMGPGQTDECILLLMSLMSFYNHFIGGIIKFLNDGFALNQFENGKFNFHKRGYKIQFCSFPIHCPPTPSYAYRLIATTARRTDGRTGQEYVLT